MIQKVDKYFLRKTHKIYIEASNFIIKKNPFFSKKIKYTKFSLILNFKKSPNFLNLPVKKRLT